MHLTAYYSFGANVLDGGTINPGWWDTTCEYCLRGEQSLCVNFKLYGEHLPGGYAEFMCVPARNVLPQMGCPVVGFIFHAKDARNALMNSTVSGTSVK